MSLRYYQKEAVDASLTAEGNPIVVLPTGSGKTHVMVDQVKELGSGVLILSHVKEILDQNFTKLVQHGIKDVAVYSAGFGMKNIGDITVAGIQSAYRNHEEFRDVSTIIVDECHLVNAQAVGMYRDFIQHLGVPIIGLTATPYRTGYGYIHLGEETIFDNICIDYTETRKFNKLVEEKYLTNLVSCSPNVVYDTEGLSTSMGDYVTNEMSDKFDKEAITRSIVESWERYKVDYKKWLIFAIDIAHAESVSRIMNECGIHTGVVHSKMDRDPVIQQFKDGHLQAIVNVGILTTGFDEPEIDLIGLLRPTKSPSLYCQMVGRGSRVAPGKDHCLVLDHAGNVPRLGEINNLNIDHKGIVKKGGGGNDIIKTCPECSTMCHPAVRVCKVCGFQFKFKHGLNVENSMQEVMAQAKNKKTWQKVDRVSYKLHKKAGSANSVQVSYHCGMRIFNEWVCPDHSGFAGHKARYWIQNRWVNGTPPRTTGDLLKHQGKLRFPEQIQVDESSKYIKILDWRTMRDPL